MREVISALRVWDAAARREVLLAPGTMISDYRICRHENGEAYTMEFESGGKTFACPLFLFQPRTEPANESVVAAAGF
jgi:hypothetical protein